MLLYWRTLLIPCRAFVPTANVVPSTFKSVRIIFVCACTPVIKYDSITVSYAWELTSVSMCSSQGDGFNISLSRSLHCTVPIVSQCRCVLERESIRDSVCCVWLSSVARSCATQDDVHKDYVCTLTTSPGYKSPVSSETITHIP